MHRFFVRFVCRIMVACMIGLPFQAQAGMIGTDRAVSAARATVAGFVNRSDVAGQLQALGLSPQAANERLAALTDQEVASLAGRIDALPAGAIAGLPLIVAVVLLFYYLIVVPSTAVKEPAKK